MGSGYSPENTVQIIMVPQQHLRKNTMKVTSLIIASAGFYLLLLSQVSGNESFQVPDQKTSIDSLMEMYAQKQETRSVKGIEDTPMDDNVKLRSEVIDLRVERDRLESRVRNLEHELKEVVVVGAKSNCESASCVSAQDVEAEKILIQAASAVRSHNIGINIRRNSQCKEAHKYADEMINGAIEDLKLLGFDTTNVDENLELDALMNQLEQKNKEAQQR